MTAVEFNHNLISMQDRLEYFANRLTQNRDDADDLVQDTFVKALSNRTKYAMDTNFKAWVYTIMKNTFINNYRRNMKASTILDTTDDLYYLNSSEKSQFASPDSSYSANEITKNINDLENEYKIPFTMHTEGFKYKEIAEKLDLSIGTVKSRIFFSRKKLMKKLQDFQQ
ncbi:sigma-70 family RNA polymerase sigma factor [Bacteroidota bacterium]